MANLPNFHTQDQNFQRLQSQWSSQLNPMLANPSLQSSILKNVQLITGSNTVNHLLGRKLVGWRIVRKRGPGSIYDTQDANQAPNLTLLLTTDTDISVDIEVF